MSYPDQSPLPDAAATLAHLIHNRQNPEPETMDVTLSVAQLLPAVNLLQEAWWGYLAAITGLDEGAAAVCHHPFSQLLRAGDTRDVWCHHHRHAQHRLPVPAR